ncbi:MAG TPA: hypothetical protein VIV66_23510 [Pyrinomonadaceae bacterium]
MFAYLIYGLGVAVKGKFAFVLHIISFDVILHVTGSSFVIFRDRFPRRERQGSMQDFLSSLSSIMSGYVAVDPFLSLGGDVSPQTIDGHAMTLEPIRCRRLPLTTDDMFQQVIVEEGFPRADYTFSWYAVSSDSAVQDPEVC